MKNGESFVTVIDAGALRAGVWDPFAYRGLRAVHTLADFVAVSSLARSRAAAQPGRFLPIEYRHIHRGAPPIFRMEPVSAPPPARIPVVGEGCLLFGTMRAYLGNAIVTPRAEWIGEAAPLVFPVKSEFVRVEPRDGLTYFWWALLQSATFLAALPAGSGGTRPRLLREQLLQTPVRIPSLAARERVHAELARIAERAWRDYVAAERLLAKAEITGR